MHGATIKKNQEQSFQLPNSWGIGGLAHVASVAQINYLSQGVVVQYDSAVSYGARRKQC